MTWYGELIACHKLPDDTQHYSEQPCLFEIVLAALVHKPEVTELSISGVAVMEPRPSGLKLQGSNEEKEKNINGLLFKLIKSPRGESTATI